MTLPSPPKYGHWLKGAPDNGGLHAWLEQARTLINAGGLDSTQLAALQSTLDQYEAGVDATDLTVSALVNDPTSTRTAVELVADAAVAPVAPDGDARAVGKGELALDVRDFGSVQPFPFDSTDAFQAAATEAQATGRPLYTPAGTYEARVEIAGPVTWRGDGYAKTIIQSADGTPLTLSGYGHNFEGLHFRARSTSPDPALRVPAGGVLSQSRFSMCQFTSQAAGVNVFRYDTAGATGGGIFDIHWEDCYFLHLPNSTVPAFYVTGDNNVFSANRFTRTRVQYCGSAPFFDIRADAAGLSNYNNVWDTINFESTNGGGIHVSSMMEGTVLNPGFFDMGTITGDLIRVGRQPTRPQSRNFLVQNYHRSGGTLSGGAKDINLVAGGNAGNSTIVGIGGPISAGITVDLGASVGYATVIGYDPDAVTVQNITSSTVLFTGQRGVTVPRVQYHSATGPIDTAGFGSPEGAVTAAVGSTFRRRDGGAGTSFYVKEAGSAATGWVGK